MNTIDRRAFVEVLNDYAFDDDINSVIQKLNDILKNKNYAEDIDLIFMAISTTQLYGFLSYLTDEEQRTFLNSDYYRSNSYRGIKIPFYNRGQLSFLNELEEYNKVFFSAPTSFGKTSIVSEYILNNTDILSNILFVVPTNSLLEELFQKFQSYNIGLQLGYNITTQPVYPVRGRNIVFLTPERFMLVAENGVIDKFELIIMDETYKIVEAENDSISDFVNHRALRFRRVADLIASANSKVIFLSPFTYELTESMERFLNKHNIEKIDRKLEYVKREVIKIDGSADINAYFNRRIVGYQKNSGIPNKVRILISELCPQSSIIYVANYTKAYEVALAIEPRCKINTNPRYQAFLKHIEENFLVDDGETWAIYEALKRGIGIYIAPLPRYIKKEIVHLFEEKILTTLVVTSAFTEGVNTCASNLIFTSMTNGPSSNKLSDIDVLNVAGRAGRFAKNTVGKVFCTSEDVYRRVLALQCSSNIKLENHNYMASENLLDYEIEMMDVQYLNSQQREQLRRQRARCNALKLHQEDLNISLNVSNNWKITLFDYFCQLGEQSIDKISANIRAIYEKEEGKREAAIEFVFRSLRDVFAQAGIEIFPHESYDIGPFSREDKFTWGRFYKMYIIGSPKQIIHSNISFISKTFRYSIARYNFDKKCQELEEVLESQGKRWILKYFRNDLSLNMNAFYTETFKIISNIIQYKIPFYLTFYVSVFKLFSKKKMCFEDSFIMEDFDLTRLLNIFEEGETSKEYERLLDCGIPLTTITKLSENSIAISQLKNHEYDTKVFDEYECIILEETAAYI